MNARLKIKLAGTHHPDWLVRLQNLGDFLLEYSQPDESLELYAIEDEGIGGLRMVEISFTVRLPAGGISGSSYQHILDHFKVLHAAESVLSTYGKLPVKPEGWVSYINDHGEARIQLLEAMGLTQAAEREFARQQREEEILDSLDASG